MGFAKHAWLRYALLGLPGLGMALAAWWLVWGRYIGPAEITLCPIPPGGIVMGSPETEDGHDNDETLFPVKITYSFWMGRTEVTQRQWREIMGVTIRQQRDKVWDTTVFLPRTPRTIRLTSYSFTERIRRAFQQVVNEPSRTWEAIKEACSAHPMPLCEVGANYPIYYATWDEIMEFCDQLNQRERTAGRLPAGYEYRLPTEAEWEYACRAGAYSRFANGQTEKDLDAMGWYEGNARGKCHPVARKQPNAWGLYDMHGNVKEWCLDRYGDDSVRVMPGSARRVVHGGCWNSPVDDCRVAARDNHDPDSLGSRWANTLGFRVVLAPPVQENGLGALNQRPFKPKKP